MLNYRPRKTKKMREIEGKFGRPLEEMLVEMYHVKNLTMKEIGAELGNLRSATISSWFRYLAIPTRVVLTEEEYKELFKRGA